MSNRIFAGIYATSPTLNAWDPSQERLFINGIKDSIPNLTGLELPFWGQGFHPHDEGFFLNHVDPKWDYTMTCMPGTMKGLEKDPTFGLASDIASGRTAALRTHELARDAVLRLNKALGRKAVQSVQIASAPRRGVSGVTSSVESFALSLKELASWDWGGASLLVEHCDAYVPGTEPVKGFMTLGEEIKAVQISETDFGILINWGRSAIEGRSALKPISHILQARDAGLLKGLIFSGTAQDCPIYGKWTDYHMPLSEIPGVLFPAKNSLLTEKAVRESLSAALPLGLKVLGFKFLSLPQETSSIEQRVGINIDGMNLLTQLLSETQ